MNKLIFKITIFSSIILALYGITPLYLFVNFTLIEALRGFSILLVLTLILWFINIFLQKKLEHLSTFIKYTVIYSIALIVLLVPIIVLTYIAKKTPRVHLLYPFLTGVLINTVIIIILNSIISEQQKQQASKKISQLQFSNLEAQQLILLQQLQPHFLFNALSTLKSLITINSVEAESYTIKLAEFYRYSIHSNTKSIVTLQEELLFTKNYIALQKVRFGESINFEVNIQKELLNYKLPIYSIQLLVENALKHNTFSDKIPIKINLETKKNVLIVSSSKHDIVEKGSTGIGLQNLNTRYRLLLGKEIEIINTPDYFKVYLALLN